MTAALRLVTSQPSVDRSSVRCFDEGDLRIAEAALQSAPDLLGIAARDPARYPFLLESSAGAAAQSRYDLLLAFPGETTEVYGARKGAFFSINWIVNLSRTWRGKLATPQSPETEADSNPEAELEETRIKARGVLRNFIDKTGRAHG